MEIITLSHLQMLAAMQLSIHLRSWASKFQPSDLLVHPVLHPLWPPCPSLWTYCWLLLLFHLYEHIVDCYSSSIFMNILLTVTPLPSLWTYCWLLLLFHHSYHSYHVGDQVPQADNQLLDAQISGVGRVLCWAIICGWMHCDCSVHPI